MCHIDNQFYPESFIEAHCKSESQRMSLPRSTDLAKKDTADYGIGIFALRAFARGELIGSFLAEETTELLQHSLQRSEGDQLHDPYFVGFLLHSCNPNVVLDMHQQKVYCIRDIAEGEPLFMDYASTEDQLYRQFACCCSSSNCRGWVTGRNEPVNLEGQHFLAMRNFQTQAQTMLASELVVNHVAA